LTSHWEEVDSATQDSKAGSSDEDCTQELDVSVSVGICAIHQEGENMSKERAKEFFEKLQKDDKIRLKVKKGLEDVAKKAGFDVTQEELNEALRELWKATECKSLFYSEPPGF
jgi:hypothetical protein